MRLQKNVFYAFCVFIVSMNFPGTSHAAPGDTGVSHVQIRLLPEKTALKGGESVTIGIEETIAPGWHVYWKNPGDSGTPTRIAWRLSDGEGEQNVKAGDIAWPVPHRMPLESLMNFGYEDRVTLLQDITLPKNMPEGPVTLKATVDLLVCSDICIPETHEASVILNGDQHPVPADIAQAQSHLPVAVTWEGRTVQKEDQIEITIDTGTDHPFARENTIALFPEEWGLIQNNGETKSRFENGILTVTHPVGERALENIPPSKIVLSYTDKTGNFKGVELSINGDGMKKALIPPSATLNTDNSQAVPGFKALQAVVFAFLGGLILNLMPCVFPVLSMKALSLVQLKDKDIAKARHQGLAYTGGILLSFAVLGAGLMALKAGGAQIGWGFQLQNPVVVLILVYLLFLIALNLAGYFEFGAGRLGNIGSRLTRKEGLTGSFFTGILAAIVATPCTAPFMGVAMGYALTQPAVIALPVFLSLGFGLAFPYLLLTYSPAFRHLLPRPGPWMETLRQFLAFPLLASAAWLLWVLAQQIDPMGVFNAMLGLLAIVFALWLLKRHPRGPKAKFIFSALAAIALLFTLSTLFTTRSAPASAVDDNQPVQAEGDNWEEFSTPRFEEALKGDAPLFINMTAAWCITCKVNEKVALNTEATRALFAARKIIYLKGDWTNQNPEISQFLTRYGRSGVPLYVYYGPRDVNTGVRPDAVVLPQILTPDTIEDTITAP